MKSSVVMNLIYEKNNKQANNGILGEKEKMVSVVEKRSVFITGVKESYSEVTFEQRTERGVKRVV